MADFGLSRVLTAEAISTGTYGALPAACLCLSSVSSLRERSPAVASACVPCVEVLQHSQDIICASRRFECARVLRAQVR